MASQLKWCEIGKLELFKYQKSTESVNSINHKDLTIDGFLPCLSIFKPSLCPFPIERELFVYDGNSTY